MFDKSAEIFGLGFGCEGDGDALAGLTRHFFGTLLRHPRFDDNQLAERVAQPADQQLMDVDRQVRPIEKRVAKRRLVAEAFGDPLETDLGDAGADIGEQRGDRRMIADFSQRRRHRTGNKRPRGDRYLEGFDTRCNDVDKLGIDQHRRTGEHHRRDLDLIADKRQQDVPRRGRTRRQRIGDRETDVDGGAVEEDRQGGLHADCGLPDRPPSGDRPGRAHRPPQGAWRAGRSRSSGRNR